MTSVKLVNLVCDTYTLEMTLHQQAHSLVSSTSRATPVDV